MTDLQREKPFAPVVRVLRNDDLLAALTPADTLVGFLSAQSRACFGQEALPQDRRSKLDDKASVAAAQTASCSGERWQSFKVVTDNSGFSCRELDYEAEAGEMAGMSQRVFDRIDWLAPRVTIAGGAPIELPMEPRFIVAKGGFGDGQFRGGTIPQAEVADAHPLWRIESDHDCAVIVAFGFVIDPGAAAGARVRPMPRELTQSPNFRADLESGKIDGRSGVAMALVLAELVLCKPRADFDPFGAASAARIFPQGSVYLNVVADIRWTVKLTRPQVSSMVTCPEHANSQMEPNGQIKSALFTDRNQGLELFFDIAPDPNWDNLFKYYDTGNDRGVVRPSPVEVIKPKSRGAPPPGSDKVQRQGAYDNIHMAPRMVNSAGVPVFMAPVCQHDCFHMHWRWSKGFPAERTFHPIRGWGENGPNTAALGAPMIPLNQSLELELARTIELTYRATAEAQPAKEWAVFMHHGGAFVDRVELKASIAPLYENLLPIIALFIGAGPLMQVALLPAGGAVPVTAGASIALWGNDWGDFYHGLRYRGDGTERVDVTHLARLETT